MSRGIIAELQALDHRPAREIAEDIDGIVSIARRVHPYHHSRESESEVVRNVGQSATTVTQGSERTRSPPRPRKGKGQ